MDQKEFEAYKKEYECYLSLSQFCVSISKDLHLFSDPKKYYAPNRLKLHYMQFEIAKKEGHIPQDAEYKGLPPMSVENFDEMIKDYIKKIPIECDIKGRQYNYILMSLLSRDISLQETLDFFEREEKYYTKLILSMHCKLHNTHSDLG